MSLTLVHEQEPHSPANGRIYLLCVFRDEFLLLEYFIQYYRDLGVTHFIMVDNDSKDQGPEYLRGLKDINLRLYQSADSYRDAAFGTAWVNTLLRRHCVDEYCFVVDIDELFFLDPDKYRDMAGLIQSMEEEDANVVATTLVDFYPESTNDDYRPGVKFLAHSPYFDDYNDEFYSKEYPIHDSFFYLKGGVRNRILGVDLCINKFPFFKFDFQPIEIGLGYHFFLSDKKAVISSEHIRLARYQSVLMHFKFIKPDFKGFVEQRINNNEDWNNSSEYRAYGEAMKNRDMIKCFDENYSRKFENTGSFDKFLGPSSSS